MTFPLISDALPEEMSIGLDLDWTGSGLWRIFLNLDWIRIVICFINLEPEPDLDWVTGRNCAIFVIKRFISLIFLFYLDLDIKLFKTYW